MNIHLQGLKDSIATLREEIVHHKVYSEIKSIEDLRLFMKYHVYAVWDFMSILKALQNQLTCTSVPWFPSQNAEVAYLINEIVLGEETDIDQNGVRKSHYELYIDAMNQCGADTTPINVFIANLKQNGNLDQALDFSNTPYEAKNFVQSTFQIIQSKKAYLQAASFTFGREDLIPTMFIAMVNEMYLAAPEQISIFKYYLERHIEVDGEHHGHLALQMINSLCGNDTQKWCEAQQATVNCLQQRIELWNGAYNEIINSRA